MRTGFEGVVGVDSGAGRFGVGSGDGEVTGGDVGFDVFGGGVGEGFGINATVSGSGWSEVGSPSCYSFRDAKFVDVTVKVII